MRLLSAGLLAAQRADSGTPAIALTVGVTDYASKLKRLYHQEKPYGGLATILLDNSDGSITADLRGNLVTIGYGFNGEGDSDTAPLWVLTQTDVSREGELLTQLICIDIWQKLSLLRVIAGGGVELKGTISGLFQPGMKVTGQTSGAKATVLGSGDGYIWVGKVAIGPFSVAEIVQADLYSDSKITVSSVTDIAGGGAPAWDGDKTILDIIQQLTAGVVTIVLDSSDGIVDVKKPTYATESNARVIDIIQDMMNYTKCAIRAGNDGKLHIFDVTAAPGTPDYSYDTVHSFFSELRDVSMILPNKIIVVNAEQIFTGVTPYYGEAEDAVAIARFGMEIPQIIFADVQSDGDATSLAESKLSRIQKEAVRGTIEVPMNCGQELFDYIRITDSRASIDFYGWIGSLDRIWEEGVYQLNIGLGGLVGAVGLPSGAEYPLPNIESPAVPPVTQFAPGMLGYPTIGAYIADVDFTSDDYNKISWSSGTVKLADGRTQSINAGNLTLTTTHYLYCILGNSTLQNSTVYSDAIGNDRMLVAVSSRASTAAQKAYVLNPHTDSILINTDKVMDGLVTELKIAAEAVTTAKIKIGAVTEALVAAGAITETKIGTNAISTPKIQAGAITAGEIAANAVTATKISALAVTAAKIAANAVTAEKILAGAITAIKINVASLDAISANVGTLTSGLINGVTILAGGGAVRLDASGIGIKGQVLRFYTPLGYYASGIAVEEGTGYMWITPWTGLKVTKSILPAVTTYNDLGSALLKFRGVFARIFRPDSGTLGGIILRTSAKAEEGSFKVAGAGSAHVYTYSNAAWRDNG